MKWTFVYACCWWVWANASLNTTFKMSDSTISRIVDRRSVNTFVMDVCHIFFYLSRLVHLSLARKNPTHVDMQIVKAIFDRPLMEKSPTMYKQFFHCANHAFQKQKLNHRPILLFFHFLKFAVKPICARGQNKTAQILTIALYKT